MKSLLILLLASGALITGCESTGGSNSNRSAKAVDINNIKTMQNKKDIYIGEFGINFITEDKTSSKSTSPMIRHSSASDYAQAVLTAKLSGVPQSTLQAITDKAYVNLVNDLEARGYNVKSYRDLQQNKHWSKISALETPYSPVQIANFMRGDNRRSVSYAPADMVLIRGPENANPYQLMLIADEIKTPILAVNYTIHFAYFDKEADYTINYFSNVPRNGGSGQTLTASVALGQGIQVVAGSGVNFIVDQGGTFSDNGHVELKDPVIILGAYGSNEDTTSGLSQAANAFNSALSLFSGGSSELKEISVNADPEFYEYGVLKAIAEAKLTFKQCATAAKLNLKHSTGMSTLLLPLWGQLGLNTKI